MRDGKARRTNCRGLMLLGAVERRGAFVVGIREVILGSFEGVVKNEVQNTEIQVVIWKVAKIRMREDLS